MEWNLSNDFCHTLQQYWMELKQQLSAIGWLIQIAHPLETSW